MANVQINVEFIPNSQGGRNLVYQGHRFRIQKKRNTSIHWRCCKAGCRATINTANDLITTYRDIHNHHSDHSKIRVDKFLSGMKDLVKTDTKPMPSLYQEGLECLRSEDAYAASQAPTFYSAHASLYSSRAKGLPPLPRQRSDVDIPNTYKDTLSGENFMLRADNQMLIFATPTNLQHLSAADCFYCDGTFSISPSIYYKLYTVHAMVNKMFPLVYGLLPDKKQSTYLSFFNILKQKAEELHILLRPLHVFTDFESATQNAIQDVFQCQFKGCMFHFRQAIWRNVQHCGLQARFGTDPEVTLFVKRASALPLVRPQDIDDVLMNALENVNLDDPSIQRFADYVTEQWVERPGTSIWNHFNTDGPRTTNHVEGWHSRLATHGPNHPHLYRFIELIKKEQSQTDITVTQMLLGGKQRPKKKKYKNLDHEIQRQKQLLLTGAKTPLHHTDTVANFVGL